jgi:hypothetical protein
MKDKEDERQIGKNVGSEKAQQLGYTHFRETSAKSNEGIEDVFIRAAKQIYIQNKNRLSDFANAKENDEESMTQDSQMLDANGSRRSSIHLSKATFVKKDKKKK